MAGDARATQPVGWLSRKRKWLTSQLRHLRSGLRGFLRIMRANPLTLVGFVMVVIIVSVAVLVVLLPPIAKPWSDIRFRSSRTARTTTLPPVRLGLLLRASSPIQPVPSP